jgi:hypothetical protein
MREIQRIRTPCREGRRDPHPQPLARRSPPSEQRITEAVVASYIRDLSARHGHRVRGDRTRRAGALRLTA